MEKMKVKIQITEIVIANNVDTDGVVKIITELKSERRTRTGRFDPRYGHVPHLYHAVDLRPRVQRVVPASAVGILVESVRNITHVTFRATTATAASVFGELALATGSRSVGDRSRTSTRRTTTWLAEGEVQAEEVLLRTTTPLVIAQSGYIHVVIALCLVGRSCLLLYISPSASILHRFSSLRSSFCSSHIFRIDYVLET
uniref:Uncharacterized protein n=1 Tax=Sipha flava TaxID=143950 RepID=A0A2S2Q2L8_9HEMI